MATTKLAAKNECLVQVAEGAEDMYFNFLRRTRKPRQNWWQISETALLQVLHAAWMTFWRTVWWFHGLA